MCITSNMMNNKPNIISYYEIHGIYCCMTRDVCNAKKLIEKYYKIINQHPNEYTEYKINVNEYLSQLNSTIYNKLRRLLSRLGFNVHVGLYYNILDEWFIYVKNDLCETS